MSNKVRTTLTLNRTVIKRAKELDINISAAAERGIIEYIKEMENLRRENTNSVGKNWTNNSSNSRQSSGSNDSENKNNCVCGCRDLNPSHKLGKLK